MSTEQRKERRGFASMTPEKQREIASKGGRAAHEKGSAHEWTADEARLSIDRISVALEQSDLPCELKLFLVDAARETLGLWQTQLARPHTRSLRAEKVFEGDDYRIVLKVHPNSTGINGRLQKALGVG